jgi:hypothetical protein
MLLISINKVMAGRKELDRAFEPPSGQQNPQGVAQVDFVGGIALAGPPVFIHFAVRALKHQIDVYILP